MGNLGGAGPSNVHGSPELPFVGIRESYPLRLSNFFASLVDMVGKDPSSTHMHDRGTEGPSPGQTKSGSLDHTTRMSHLDVKGKAICVASDDDDDPLPASRFEDLEDEDSFVECNVSMATSVDSYKKRKFNSFDYVSSSG